MVATTMNGWSLTAVPLATIEAGDHSTQVRAGAVATVLGHVARRFHAEVEPLVTFNGWRSVATNAAVGGHPRSNHPSGTALDFNGYAHPYKAPVNFTAAQVAAIRRILAEVAPVVRWGGDFGAALRDGMHFEIVGDAAQVADVAARLTPTPAPAQEDDMPTAQEVAQAVWTMALGPTGATSAAPAWAHLIAAREAAAGASAAASSAAAAVGPLETADPHLGPAALAVFVGDTRTDVMRILDIAHGQTAQIAALQAALGALATGQGADPAAITAAAEAGARAALAGLVLRADA